MIVYLAHQAELKIDLVYIFPIHNHNSGCLHEYVSKQVEQ
jgi:hypothetical protein